MTPASDPARSRRCAHCGSRLPLGGQVCDVCGAAVPWHRTRLGPLAALAAALACVALAGLVWGWMRSRDAMVAVSPPAAVKARSQAPVAQTPAVSVPPLTPLTPSVGGGASIADANGAVAAAGTTVPVAPTEVPAPVTVTYTVQKGDNLWAIARDLGVDQGALLALNPGADQRLPVGSALVLPVTATPAAPSVAEAAPVAEGATGTPPPIAAPAVYVAHAGDTLASVAAEHGLSVPDLAAMNQQELDADADRLVPGQLLRVRTDVVAAPAEDAAAAAVRPFTAPMMLAPANVATVHDDAPLLRWASAGILPSDVYYVVTVRDVDAPDPAAMETVWVASNATTLAVPARFRPAPGGRRNLAWVVTVRRSLDGRPGPGSGELLSDSPEEHAFAWLP